MTPDDLQKTVTSATTPDILAVTTSNMTVTGQPFA
jgi:hypothetical protein